MHQVRHVKLVNPLLFRFAHTSMILAVTTSIYDSNLISIKVDLRSFFFFLHFSHIMCKSLPHSDYFSYVAQTGIESSVSVPIEVLGHYIPFSPSSFDFRLKSCRAKCEFIFSSLIKEFLTKYLSLHFVFQLFLKARKGPEPATIAWSWERVSRCKYRYSYFFRNEYWNVIFQGQCRTAVLVWFSF